MKHLVGAAALKLLRGLLTLWITLTLLFCMLVWVKGNPISLYVNPNMTPELRANLERVYGYDRPPLQQYFRYMANLCRGEMGTSFNYKRPVVAVLADHIAPSLWLGLGGYATGTLLSLLLLYGLHLGPKPLRVIWNMTFRINLIMPAFITGALLLALLAVKWPLFPIYGKRDLFSQALTGLPALWDLIKHSFLPVMSLALPFSGVLTAFLQDRLLQLEDAPFVLSARGRGISERRIFLNHKMRVVLPSLIQVLGLYLPTVAGGSMIIEAMYGWNGMGLLMIEAVFSRDYPLLLGGCGWAALMVIPGYELSDYLRTRLEHQEVLG